MERTRARLWSRGWRVGVWLISATVSATVVVAAPPSVLHAEEAPLAASVGDNMDVGMEYTLMVDGAIVESTEGREPFHYIHGRSQMITGLERQLTGLHVGETAEVSVSPEEGYGPLDPAAFIEIPKTQLPADVPPEVGMVLQGVNPDGQRFQARINKLKEENAILDLNHPLAGKTLKFKVKILDISPAPAQ